MKAWHFKKIRHCVLAKKQTKNQTSPDHENIPDKRVIVHNNEPLGFWDRAAQKSLKDCECFTAVACK